MSVLAVQSRRLSGRRALARARQLSGTAWVSVTVVMLAALVGRFAFVGGDARWLAALGRVIVHHGIPDGVPFASAPTLHWHNPLVLAELLIYAFEHAFGDPGLVAAQTVAVALGLGLLARDMRLGGARTGAIMAALAMLVIGALISLAIVRVQLFSLALFPALLLLVRADARRPSRAIWLLPLLVALWSNLHGAVLAGLVVLYPYLLLARLRGPARRFETVAVAIALPLALCLTPAGLQTISYYRGVMGNVAAQRGAGMWAPLGTGAFDLALIAVAATMALLALRARPRPRVWQLVATAILAAATVKASRDGVWLLMTLAGPAAIGLSRRWPTPLSRLGLAPDREPVDATDSRPAKDWVGLIPPAAVCALLLVVGDVLHWSAGAGAPTPAPVARAVALAHGTPILADTVPGEEVALAGGRIWAGNPLDAFSTGTQAQFLDFDLGLSSGSAALGLPQIRVVLVSAGSAAARLVSADAGFRPLGTADGYSLFVRR